MLMTKGDKLILQKIDSIIKKLNIDEESTGIMVLSEEALKKDWDNSYDERWNKY